MSATETVRADLEARFPRLAGAVRVQRERRLWVDVPQESFPEVFESLVKQMGFSTLCTITAWTSERSWVSSTISRATTGSWST